MAIGYAAFSTNININAKGNILEKSRVIQRWTDASNEDFHTDYYKENIVNATFLDNNNVPDNATEYWNVSENKNKGGVMAWVVPNNEDSTKYDLYIGAKDGVIANENSGNLFYDFINIKNIEFGNNFDTSNTTSMYRMFCNCQNLITIDLSSFDTSEVTNISGMFQMFDHKTLSDKSSKLETIIFGDNFDTSKVTTMGSLFYHCNSLKKLDLSNWDTSNVTTMSGMFYACFNLSSLDLSSFNTEKVTTMYAMFWGDSSLETLNLCSFDTSNVRDMYRMFREMHKITNIYVGGKWTMDNVVSSGEMFLYSNVSEVTTGQC